VTDQRPSSSPANKGTGDDIDALLNNSSLGSVGARRLRARTPATTRTSILDQVAERRNRETAPIRSAGQNRTASDSSAKEDPATANDRHVVPSPDGGWDVVKPGASRSSAHTNTQQQAIDRGREIVHNADGGEVIIHGRDGAIRAKDTIAPGKDTVPPRG